MSDAVSGAVAALQAGLPVLVADDHDRENEADVVLAAETTSTEWVAWTIRMTSGLLCAPLTAELAQRLSLPQMVTDNQDPKSTAYTVSVDARQGVTTGISAGDRRRTLDVLADPSSTSRELIRPGHVFPLQARDGGVLERPGHTEAAVDLCRIAGLRPVAAIAELVTDTGEMMRMAAAEELGRRLDLPVLTIAELVRFRQAHPELLAHQPAQRVQRSAETEITTAYGRFRAIGYRDLKTGAEHLALVGRPDTLSNIESGSADAPLVRVHSECLTGEAFRSHRCDCGPQLDAAMTRTATHGGVVIYLRGHEGRGIGLLKKIAAYRLQDTGLDTVQANLELDEPADAREYGAAAAILDDLSIGTVQLLTNNPDKIAGLEAGGITVALRIPLIVGVEPDNIRYLQTKRERLGQLLPRSVSR